MSEPTFPPAPERRASIAEPLALLALRIWDADTAEQITALFAPPNSLLGASFDETGTAIITWDEGVIRTADCAVCGNLDELHTRAVRAITRQLTPSERRLYGG